ncbi:MAG: phage holin family protein [Gemmatimonadaceae bacterium]
MTVDIGNGRRSLGKLLGDLANGSSSLVRQEVRLARLEVAALLSGVARGAALVATGGVLAVMGALSVLTGLVLLAGDQWLRDRYWVAALMLAAVAAGLAAWFAKQGITLLSPHTLAPDQTVATLKEDREWLKQRLTSGETSR